MGEILLVRHAQASFGAADYDQLSPIGAVQSGLLRDWFVASGRRFTAIVTGGMKRHLQTAAPSLEAGLGPGGIERGFDEFDHRGMLARLRPELAEPGALPALLAAAAEPRRVYQDLFAAAFARWCGGEHDDEYRESWGEFRRRSLGAIQRLIAAGPSQRVLVVTSGGPIAAIAQAALGVPDERVADLFFALANGAATRLLYRGDRFTIGYFNNYHYLEQSGDPSLVTYR
jgi:broad specificity phosphatase PhoE